ncbi:rhodanese-like domain-containing protein [Oceanicoccus sagamiensis]|uniref:Rhodanese domain-containing protein n=1 Tax=Oceanicoccus sagamiensis TaxID=716816 RepID=A0A1X9N7I6_9GAMM|nr:rhodanese-like domain-containing protein [Oceanicoccus sagamiensis]ARN74038.1 hypothetical protein BST96_07845 [Oceanicoccus sagamiensis]
MNTLLTYLLALSLLLLAACTHAEKAATISQQELVTRMADQSTPTIIDVRTAEEFQQGHVPGAIHVPYDNYKNALQALGLKAADEVVVYCEKGGRAKKVEHYLEQQGFGEVRHLEGDMSAWRSASLPVE